VQILTVNALKNLLKGKNGNFQFQEALAKMGWDTEKFEEELEIYAKTQTPQLAERIRKEYNRFMSDCGWPLELVDVDENDCGCIKIRVPKKNKPVPQENTPKTVIKPENTPESTSKIEVAVAEIEKAAPIETVPLPQPVSEQEKKSEPPKQTPKTENAEIDTNAKTTAYFSCGDANLFKKLYECMTLLVKEVTWKISKDSLSMRQMDPNRVALIDLEFGKENFEEFDVKTPGLVTFDAKTIKEQVFAKTFKKGTSIGVKIDGATDRITFILKDSGTRERSFVTLDAEQEDVPTPKISVNARCKVVSKQVAEDIKELNKVSDHMTIIATAESLKMQANGNCGTGQNTYQRGDETLLDIEVREESTAKFSFSYLKDFIQPALCEVAVLEFATDMPIKITQLTKFGELKYFVAPRIETE
jgi:proliferating cell nuclear antigen